MRSILIVTLAVGGAVWAAPAWAQAQGPAWPSAPLNFAHLADDVQARVLADARGLFADGRYEQAARALTRLAHRFPQTAWTPEVAWWLALARERCGEWRASLEQYQVVASNTDDPERLRHARDHIRALERILAGRGSGWNGWQAALRVPVATLPSGYALEEWVIRISHTGATILLVGVSSHVDRHAGHGVRPGGVLFDTDWAPVLRNAVGELVPIAHRHGLSVWGAVSVRALEGLLPAPRERGSLHGADTSGGERSSADLLYTDQDESLVGLLTDLAATDVDGLLFLSDGAPEPDRTGAERSLREQRGGKTEPDVWRTMGGRVKAELDRLAKLAEVLRQRAPFLETAVEVHAEAIIEPAQGLARYGEDIVQAAQSGFRDFVVRAGGASNDPAFRRPPAERLVRLLGATFRVWIESPDPVEIPRDLVGRRHLVPRADDRQAYPPGTVWVYDVSPSSLP